MSIKQGIFIQAAFYSIKMISKNHKSKSMIKSKSDQSSDVKQNLTHLGPPS